MYTILLIKRYINFDCSEYKFNKKVAPPLRGATFGSVEVFLSGIDFKYYASFAYVLLNHFNSLHHLLFGITPPK